MNRWKLERAKGKLQDSPEKRDEVRAISALAGMLLGSAVGVPVSVALGLLGSPGDPLPSYDFIGNLMDMFSFFGLSMLFGCVIALAVCAYFWREEGQVKLAHCAMSSFTLFGGWMYILLLFSFVFIPFNVFLLQYFTPVSVFWDVMLAFFPFMVIFVYISLPMLRPRIRHQLGLLATRSFWAEIRKNPKKHGKMLLICVALAVIIFIEILGAL